MDVSNKSASLKLRTLQIIIKMDEYYLAQIIEENTETELTEFNESTQWKK